MPVDVSILIVNYKTRSYLRDCVQSLLAGGGDLDVDEGFEE